MGTHINAYYGVVEEKKQALAKAKDELATAERELKDHPDYEEPKKAKEAKKETDTPEVDAPKRDNKGHFVPITPSK